MMLLTPTYTSSTISFVSFNPLTIALSLLFFAFISIVHCDNNAVGARPLLHHPPVLTYSNAALPTQKLYHPTSCVLHKSGVYLVVTSIGQGFPRVQFTCTETHHPHPTPDVQQTYPPSQTFEAALTTCSYSSCPYEHHLQHLEHTTKKQSQGLTKPQNCVQDPADPTPAQSPMALHRVYEGQPGEDGKYSTCYTDHITSTDTALHSFGSIKPSWVEGLGKYGYDVFQDEFIFSPRERASENTETHSMTQTYSDHETNTFGNIQDKSSIRTVSSVNNNGNNNNSVNNKKTESSNNLMHGQQKYEHVDQKKKYAGFVSSVSDNSHSVTRPETIPTLAAPTSTPNTHGVTEENSGAWFEKLKASLTWKTEKQKIGPASPTPEPLPLPGSAQTSRSAPPLKDLHKKDCLNPALCQHSQDHYDHGHKNKGMKHRATTLIIETETIIVHSHPTQAPTFKKSHETNEQVGFYPGSHVMFDAGMEGDVVMSMVAQEHYHPSPSPRHHKKKK
ncbi:hypothetical protein BCR41DRAFT_388139 [Lobosporangium transversale]|uniref:Uncharacterized protein n=1 Tax=Lobosporangium transversale TaxID=64571 RepID=A0A1Y2GGB8_9FUNG|nr:hypothetical protein BCR41DRAFT_388139 [Lobosporangium transversale]ORZ10028.1 hypothetical protein BCR41DRAFT_388139 [Lobosporangium transversale]|eukprot:XP_021879118.1 hypothetical protein BCR41DRAFT_388139 [Lobosporangium transversale]